MKRFKKNIIVFSDFQLLLEGLLLCVSVLSLCGIICYRVYNGDISTATQVDKYGIIGLFIFFAIAMILAIVLCSPTWCTIYVFGEDGINVITGFSKNQKIPYSRYKFSYCGYYLHMGFKVWYIILSRKFIKEDHLKSVNQLSPSKDLLKIRFSKRKLKLVEELIKEQNLDIDMSLYKSM